MAREVNILRARMQHLLYSKHRLKPLKLQKEQNLNDDQKNKKKSGELPNLIFCDIILN